MSAIYTAAQRGLTSGPKIKKYQFVEGILEKRGPYRSAHLEMLQDLSIRGDCLLAGAYMEPADGSMLLFQSKEAANEFALSDPYTKAGLVKNWKVREYAAVSGSLLPKL